jgi:hypothetical protein
MKARSLPSQDYLASCFDYNSDTGELIWKRRPVEHFKNPARWSSWNQCYAGTVAGTINDRGYYHVLIQGHHYTIHRIVWKLVKGEEPPEFVDHEDRNRGNNRIRNLRAATRREQRWNSRLNKDNRAGLRGVGRRKNKWMARIKVDGKSRCLGTFDTAEEASAAYQAAARELHGEFFSQ